MNEKQYWAPFEPKRRDRRRMFNQVEECLSAPDPTNYHIQKYSKLEANYKDTEDLSFMGQAAMCGYAGAITIMGIGLAIGGHDVLNHIASAINHLRLSE